MINPVMVYMKFFGEKKSKWIKLSILGFIVFCFIFSDAYLWFTGKFLAISWIGINNIPAKLLAIALAGIAWDSYLTG